MNNNDGGVNECGENVSRSVESPSKLAIKWVGQEDEPGTQQPAVQEEIMKRTAAKQLIEAYYFQLTDGCGNERCTNKCCASSPQFSMKDKDRNALALHSIELFKNKAQLCESGRSKMAKLPKNESQPVLGIPSTSTAEKSPLLGSLKTVLPGPSKEKAMAISPSGQELSFLSEEKLKSIVQDCRFAENWSSLIKAIGSVYSNPDSLMESFQFKCTNRLLKEKLQSVEIDMDIEEGKPLLEKKSVFDNAVEGISVDLQSLGRSYELLMDIPEHPFQAALINALLSLSKTVDMELKYRNRSVAEPVYLNLFVIVMEIPLLHSPEFIESAFPEFCKAMGRLPLASQARLARYWSSYKADKLKDMILSIQQLITVKLIHGESRWGRGYSLNDEEHITGPIKVLKILYYASLYGGDCDPKCVVDEEREMMDSENHLQQELRGAGAMGHDSKEPKQPKDDPLAKELEVSHLDCRHPLVPFEDFVNETLNENINVETDYKNKLESEDNQSKFSFANYSFVLTTASKQMSLYMDNRIQMYKERRSSIMQTIMHGMPPMPFLRIRVSRDRIIDDALVALEMVAMENPSDLRKQLFVEFDGEQGLDEGGVSKEFFQLIVEEIFNVDFGMFTYSQETHQYWFNPMSFENDAQFTLIGIVLGLAIYNSTIVDVHFPAVVYRKLVGKKGTIQDLGDVDPTIAKSLLEMQNYEDDDFEDVFMQTFQISYKDVFGSTITHNLKENGDTIPVTKSNRKEFIGLYADFILNKSIEKQFRAFRRGFQMVTSESPLRSLFLPHEIELLICGSENLDFHELEEATEYDGGFEKTSTTVRHFWEVVHNFNEEQKRKLIQFTTGTDRVPVGGLAKLKLIIARNGPDSDRLPTAHTCFNVLLLPDYENRDKLEERLLKAITYSKGFGML